MSFKIKYDSIRQLKSVSDKQFTTWQNDLKNIQSSLEDIVNMDAFQGKTAESVKSYIEEVHYLLIDSIMNVMADFQQKLLVYSNGYYHIDANEDTVITEDALDYTKGELANQVQKFEVESDDLRTVLKGISDIIDLPNPSPDTVFDHYRHIDNKIDTLKQDVKDYEKNKLETDLVALENHVNAIKATIDEFKSKTRTSIVGYVPGEYKMSQNVMNLAEQFKISEEYSKEHSEEIKTAKEQEKHIKEDIKLVIVESKDEKYLIELIDDSTFPLANKA